MFFVPLIMHSPQKMCCMFCILFVNNLLFTYLINKIKKTQNNELLYVRIHPINERQLPDAPAYKITSQVKESARAQLTACLNESINVKIAH